MRKTLIVALALSATLMLMTACTSSPWKDGSYQGEGAGFKGPIVVSVEISKGKISAINVVSHADTPGISDDAFSKVPAAIIKKQSTKVDVVSNVTWSSRGVIEAVEQALEKARKK